MPRMILAHPRSRSHLLGSVFPDYVNELFTPGFIVNTPYYHQHAHLLNEDSAAGFDSQFSKGYIQWLDMVFNGRQFTFKVHYCDIYAWTDAKDLISKWQSAPGWEFFTCERLDKQQAVYSDIIADLTGYVSYSMKEADPTLITFDRFKTAYDKVVTAWEAGLKAYPEDPVYAFNYEGMLHDIKSIFFGNDQLTFQEFLIKTRFQDQKTGERLALIQNMNELDVWYADQQRQDKERRNAITR